MATAGGPDLETIRRRYQALLDGNAGEPAFQRFFTTHPQVLAGGLPKRIDVRHLRACGRPGKSEADFLFAHLDAAQIEFGVIELKQPRMRILKSPRKLVVTLTNAATTAVAQAREYAARLKEELRRIKHPEQSLDAHPRMYVVMGTADPQSKALLAGLDERQLRAVFPEDVRIVTYDVLLARFLERAQVRSLSEKAGDPAGARDYLMLPLYRDPDFPRRPFALSAPPALLDVMRRARVSEISIYSRSHATASADECRGVVDQHSDCGMVYLLVTNEGIFIVSTLRNRVVDIERTESKDERDALAAAGAVEHLLHMSMDDSVEPWWVKSASELPPTER